MTTFYWGLTENSGSCVWHVLRTPLGPALSVPQQAQPQDMGVTSRLRAQTGLRSHFSWSSCPGVGVCGDSHTCCGFSWRCREPTCWGSLGRGLQLFLLAARTGLSCSAAGLGGMGGGGGDGNGHLPPQLYQVGFQALPIPCPSNT